jgi:NADPH:quinone reductase-like Zn-dependent oxidoreductase
MVRSIGADQVIDYTKDDFTTGGQQYDLMFDCAGTHSLSDRRRALTPTGTLVMVGGPMNGHWVAPFIDPLKALLLSRFVSQKLRPVQRLQLRQLGQSQIEHRRGESGSHRHGGRRAGHAGRVQNDFLISDTG